MSSATFMLFHKLANEKLIKWNKLQKKETPCHHHLDETEKNDSLILPECQKEFDQIINNIINVKLSRNYVHLLCIH